MTFPLNEVYGYSRLCDRLRSSAIIWKQVSLRSSAIRDRLRSFAIIWKPPIRDRLRSFAIIWKPAISVCDNKSRFPGRSIALKHVCYLAQPSFFVFFTQEHFSAFDFSIKVSVKSFHVGILSIT